MKTKKIHFSIMLSAIIFLQTACSNQRVTEPITTIAPTEALIALEPTTTSVPTSTQILTASLTPIPTIDPTEQVWHATAIAIQATERAVNQQARDEKVTQIAQFSIDCQGINSYPSSISPDGKWFAASCGGKRDQKLVVQNTEGTKWTLEFKDFLSPESPNEMPGSLAPKFWSPDGDYLYFTIGLGYSGGGDYCFPEHGDYGDYGLFRLNLRKGSWATVIPSTDTFPGYEIEFSPTGRRYAITMDGVMITDLQTGQLTRIEIEGAIERLSWSPDGKYLAYSVASCDEQNVLSSSTNVWEASTNQTQILMKTDGIILRPESWADDSTLRIIGEEISGLDTIYTVYQYDIQQGDLLFKGTATPYP